MHSQAPCSCFCFREEMKAVAKIKLICEQCGGNIILDNSHEIGTCENCYAQFVVKQDQIVQKITQNITKYVYGYQGKDVEELLTEAYRLKEIGSDAKANGKFKRAIDIEPECWSAWIGYAQTGGSRSGYLSAVDAHIEAYNIASDEQEESDTFVSLVCYLPDKYLRAAFIRAFNLASRKDRHHIFSLVSGVVGCDDSEIASLAIDLCPDDWRAYFAMAKFRQIRARWCELEGNIFTGKHLPAAAQEVLNIFMKAYSLAKAEGEQEKQTVVSYIDSLGQDNTYCVFTGELKKAIKKAG